MSKPDTWMPLVIRDYLADTGHLSTAEHGAYLLLLMTAWTRGGSLPDDDAQLARITRASGREWKMLRASLAPFFHAVDGEWRQKRLLKELDRACATAAKAGAKASKAAAERWGKEATRDAPSIPTSNDYGLLDDLHKQSPIPIPPASLRSAGKTRRVRPDETPIADDFKVSDRVRSWAVRKGFVDLDRYLETFVGRNKASGRTYHDWDQAFMNAVREDWYGIRSPKLKPNGAAQGRAEVAQFIFNRGENGKQANPEHDITAESERVA